MSIFVNTKPELNKEIKYRPRIGIDVRPLAYGITGNSRYLFEVLKYIIRDDSNFDFYLYSNKEVHSIFQDFFVEYSEKIHFRIYHSSGPIWLNFHIPKSIQLDRIDIFWGTLQLLPFQKLNIPTIVNYHDLNFVKAPSTMTKINYIQHRFLSNLTLKNADRIFCLSKNTMNDILEYNPTVLDKLTVIYPGVICKDTVHEPLPFTSDYLLTIGTIEPRKNIATLVKAYLQLKQENPEFPYKLIIAGRLGWGEKQLSHSLKNGNYEKQGILFIENPNESLLNLLLENCSVFLFPSLHEGFGLPLLEAMSKQKMCIASNLEVFKEILDEESDRFVEPLELSSWKKAILESAQFKFKRKNPWNSKEWTWEHTAQQIESQLNSIWRKKVEKNLIH